MAAPDRDLAWLERLPYGDWMRAALHELEHAYRALAARNRRQGLSHARRAAGMGLNALLRVRHDDAYGRTYLDHLRALDDGKGEGAEAPAAVRAAAHHLATAKEQPALVTLRPAATGPGDVALAEAAKVVLVWVADRLPAE